MSDGVSRMRPKPAEKQRKFLWIQAVQTARRHEYGVNMTQVNFVRRDRLLMGFVVFDILNIVLYLFALLNLSLNAISIVFAMGVCNLLFAMWILYRAHKPQYVQDYGMICVRQSSYYMRSVFIGAVLIAFDLVAVAAVFTMLLRHTIGSKTDLNAVDACRNSVSMIIDYDPSLFAQFVLNNYSCYFGEGHMFTLVGPFEPDFSISLLQTVFEKIVMFPSGYIYAIYALFVFSMLPFFWLLFRMFRLLKMMRRNEG